MIKRGVIRFLVAVFVLAGLSGQAQIMPVGVNVVMNPPSPVFLADYYSIGSNAFQAYVTLNDLNEPSWNVKLRIRVEGQGIVIETKPGFIPPAPINLISGVPTILDGLDLASYMNVNNVNLQGITAASLNQNGKLPEGLYQFCVQVLDYNSGTPLSHRTCGSAFIFYENPPVLMMPACETAIQPTDPQNVYFHWQISGGASPTIAATSQYKLFVYELQNENENPYYAVQNNKALLIYESDWTQGTSQTIDFGMSNAAPLIPGKRYIYRVRAVDANFKNIYKNDGFSEFCWFFYGYPTDGVITLNNPVDGFMFGKSDNPYFSWSASDKGVPGQQYEYIINIHEMQPGQTKVQALNNPTYFSTYLPVTTSVMGYDYLLSQPLDPGKHFVWQIKAMTETQVVAQSVPFDFYSTAEIDQFLAGNNAIKVLSLSSYDKVGVNYNNVSGVGRIQLSDDAMDYVDAPFSNLTISNIGGYNVLDAGTFNFDISNRTPKVLTPKLEENGPAKFHYANGNVSPAGLKMEGYVSWNFPHATASGALETVKTANALFTLNSLNKLNGTASLGESKEYVLLEPHELKIALTTGSQISIVGDEYSLSLAGKVKLNNQVETNNGSPYEINLHQQTQLYYIEASNLLVYSTNFIKPIQGLNMALMPKSATIDLSDAQSPGKLSSQPSWKGVFFPDFQVRLSASGFDATSQVYLPNNIDFHETTESHDFWISEQGLKFNYSFVSDLTGIRFNGFRTTVEGTFDIKDNETSSSKIRGSIKIPVISEDDDFGFEIPIITQGLQQGYLYEDLTLRNIVFNPFGGENRVNVSINRAVFADNERLDLEIDAHVVAFDAQLKGITDFRVYGDNNIGLGKKNGALPLTQRVKGKYKGFDAYITDVGASLTDGAYVLSYIAEMDLGDDVTGESGPPKMSVSSVTMVGNGVEVPVYAVASQAPVAVIPVPDVQEASQSQTLTSREMFIAVNNSIVDIEGYLKLRANDPVWGNSFAGGINGAIKIPTVIEAGANMILGNKDGLKFWYFDAWFNDTEGMGLKVGSLFNITAMEGRIYHHMSLQNGEFMIDPALNFGAALYMQLIDPSGGRLWASDVGAEVKVFSDGEFTIGLKGEVAVLNKNQRQAASGGMTAAVGEALAEEAMAMVGPLSLTLNVGGGQLTVEAKSLQEGSVKYTLGEYAFNVGANVSSTPKASFGFAKGGDSFNIGADASGSFDLGVGISGNQFKLGMQGKNSGYLELKYGGLDLGASINRSNKTGSFNLAYDGKVIGIGASTNSGFLNLQLAPDKVFKSGFSAAGSAYIELKYGSNEFKLAGDKVAKSGSLAIAVPGFSMALGASVEDKSGSFSLSTSGVDISMAAQKSVGGHFRLNTSDLKVELSADLPSKSGSLGYEYDGGNRAFYAGLDGGDQGEVRFKNGSQEFGIAGNKDGSAGMVSFKDGSNEFKIAADRNEGTGELVLKMGGDGFSSAILTDSAYVNFDYSNISFAVGASQNSGGLTFTDGTTTYGIYGDKASAKGGFEFESSGNRVVVSTDLNKDEHLFEISTNDASFSASSKGDEQEIGFRYQQYEAGINKKAGTAGGLNFTDGNLSFALEADPSAGTGKIAASMDGNSIVAESTGDSAYVSLEYDGYTFGAGVSENNSGGFSFSQGGNSFSMEGNPANGKGSASFNYNGQVVEASADIPGKKGSINIESGDFKLNGEVDQLDGNIRIEKNNYAVFATKEGNDFEVGTNAAGFELSGGVEGNAPLFKVIASNLEVGLKNNKLKVSYSGKVLELSEDALIIDGVNIQEMIANADVNITKNLGSLSVTIGRNSGVYNVGFSVQGSSLAFTTSDFENGSIELGAAGQTFTLGKDNTNYSLSVGDLAAEYEPGKASLSYGSNKKFELTSGSLDIDVNDYKFNFTPSSFKFEHGSALADISANALNLKYDDYKFYLDQQKFGLQIGANKKFDLSTDEVGITVDDFSGSYKIGDKLTASYQAYSLMLDPAGKLEVSQGNNRKLGLSADEIDLTFDGHSFSVTETAFKYTDGNNLASISEDGIALKRGANELFLSSEEFGVKVGESKRVALTSSSMDVKYNNYEASFSSGESLSFTDGTRSFALSNTGLEMADGNKSIAVLDDNGAPAIRLTNGSDLFELSQKGFAVEYAGKRYAVNEEEYLSIEIDQSRRIEVKNNGLAYFDSGFEFIIGGDENYVELKEGEKRIAYSLEEKLHISDGSYWAWLSKDLSAAFGDGTRTVTLLEGENYLTYEQEPYFFGIRGAGGSKPGIDFSNGEYSFFVEGEANSDATVGVTAPSFGSLTATVDSNKDIEVVYSKSTTENYGFSTRGGLTLINGEMPGEPSPEYLEGSPSIPAQDGPQYLTNSISEWAGGSIKGKAEMFFDSRQKRFMLNAAVDGKSPVCITGAMYMDVKPGDFKLQIGTEEQRVEIFPTCSGFGGGGWLGIHNTNVDLGVFAGWKASAGVSIGNDAVGASLTASASAELGARANVDLDPFKINRVGVWVEIYAGIYARYWAVGASGSLTIAEIYLKGTLDVYFEEKTRVTGTLAGSINILDLVKASFSMGFNTTI